MIKTFKYTILLIITVLIFSVDITLLINFAHDDSFFYIKTADNFSRGFGSSFDTINITNGYHPFYFWILTLYFFVINIIIKTTPELLFRFVVILHLFIGVFNIIVIKNIIKICNKRGIIVNNWGISILYTLFFSLILIRDIGTEAHISVLLFSCLYYFYIGKNVSILKNKIIIGSLILGLLLSRTDLIFTLFTPFMIYSLIKYNIKDFYKKYYVYLAFVIPAMFLNLFYNYYLTGEIYSISSLIINSFPQILLFNNLIALFTETGGYITVIKLIVLIILIIFTTILNLRYENNKDIKPNKDLKFILLLSLGTLLFCFLHLAFNKYGLRSWYMAIPSFCIILMSLKIIQVLNNKKIIKYISALCIIMAIIYFSTIRIFNNKFKFAYNYSKSVERFTGIEDRTYQIDFSGIIGFFSSRIIINGDGLINSFEYYEAMKNNRLKEFLIDLNIKYYSFYVWTDYYEDESHIYDIKSGIMSNGLFFQIKKNDIVLKEPYFYEYALENHIGYWYLTKFKLE